MEQPDVMKKYNIYIYAAQNGWVVTTADCSWICLTTDELVEAVRECSRYKHIDPSPRQDPSMKSENAARG